LSSKHYDFHVRDENIEENLMKIPIINFMHEFNV